MAKPKLGYELLIKLKASARPTDLEKTKENPEGYSSATISKYNAMYQDYQSICERIWQLLLASVKATEKKEK